MNFPFYQQHDAMDCGPTCLRMIMKFYGKSISLQRLRQYCQINRDGVSLLGISEAAERLGMKTISARIDFLQLKRDVILPCIVHLKQNHFVVVFKINSRHVFIADPGRGRIRISHQQFLEDWKIKGDDRQIGVVLALEPSGDFQKHDEETYSEKNVFSFSKIFKYFIQHKRLFFHLLAALSIGSAFQVVAPFVTQTIVDVGIATQDLNLITLILLGQLALHAGSAAIDFIKSWILLHISARVNLSMLTDFLIKMMKLPISFFEAKHIGDISQRLSDCKRVESFLTNSVVGTIFSIINFVVFTVMVVSYDVNLFLIFVAGSTLYFIWIFIFLKARKSLDYRRFDVGAASQNTTIELLQGMQEIKLNNCERSKRWNWEYVQAKQFRLGVRSLIVDQSQQAGALFINQGRNILISYLTAKAVISGELTLGGMMALQYIVGQLNSPIQQIITFIQSLQNAKISLDRINEVSSLEDEDPDGSTIDYRHSLCRDIRLKGISFKYPGAGNDLVLDDLNITIPNGKTTAIVGLSGSGKTTLLKLLLKIYSPDEGVILIDNARLATMNTSLWRKSCGTVMQDGFIFSDTIAANIAVSDETPNMEKVIRAAQIANISDFIESLPLNYNTKIGAKGNGISSGQKQRILIARAVYKNPEFIFLDEATNSLDSQNEQCIVHNLQTFFKGKTVVVVAHRLSTVKNADQIIVLDKGRVKELGTHIELSRAKGDYYHLVKNQLELETN